MTLSAPASALDAAESSDPDTPSRSHFWNHTRHLILFVSVLCVAAAKSNDFTFTFTVICMTSNTSEYSIPLSPREISYAFASAGLGSLIACIAIALLLHHLGARIVFPATLILAGLATFFLPFVASHGIVAIIPFRFVQGIAVAAVMPAIGFITAHWAPISEMGKFMTMLTAGIQISQIFTMPLSGELCVNAGWQYSYYIHGLISIVFGMIFFVIFTDSPEKHSHVSQAELNIINTSGGVRRGKRRPKVPYRAIVSSKSIIAIWIAFYGNTMGFQMILQFMPTFLNKVVGIPIDRTGFSAIIPPLTQVIVKMIGGCINDRMTFIPERRKLQLFNTLAMGGCGLFLLPLGYLSPGSSSFLAIVFFTGSVACLGLITCGSIKSVTLISRQYSHFVMAIVQVVVSIGYLTVPLLVSTVAPNNTITEWRIVFMIVCAILLLTNGVFCYWCDSEPAEWTKPRAEEADRKLIAPSDGDTVAAKNGVTVPSAVINVSNGVGASSSLDKGDIVAAVKDSV